MKLRKLTEFLKMTLERFLKIAATRVLIQIILTAAISVSGTLFVQRIALEDAKAQTLRAEQRAAFIEVWYAEEKYVLSLDYLQERMSITNFAARFPDNNPVAQIFLSNFRQAMQHSEQLRNEAKVLLKTKQILMSEPQLRLATSFLEALVYDPNEDQSGREMREKSIREFRRQAKEIISSI